MKKAERDPSLFFADYIKVVLAIVTPDSQNTLINGIDSQSVAQILTAQKKGTLFDQAAWQLCQEKNKAFGQAQAAWQANVASFALWCDYIAALQAYRAALADSQEQMQAVAPDYVSLNAYDRSFEQLGFFFSRLKGALNKENDFLTEQQRQAGAWAIERIKSWTHGSDSAAAPGLFKEVSDQPVDRLRTLLNQIGQLWLGSYRNSLNDFAVFAYVSHVVEGQFRFQHAGQNFNLSIPSQSAWLPWLFAGYQARYQLFYHQVALVYIQSALAGNPLSKERQEAVRNLGAEIKTVRARLFCLWLFQYETCRVLDALAQKIEDILQPVERKAQSVGQAA